MSNRSRHLPCLLWDESFSASTNGIAERVASAGLKPSPLTSIGLRSRCLGRRSFGRHDAWFSGTGSRSIGEGGGPFLSRSWTRVARSGGASGSSDCASAAACPPPGIGYGSSLIVGESREGRSVVLCPNDEPTLVHISGGARASDKRVAGARPRHPAASPPGLPPPHVGRPPELLHRAQSRHRPDTTPSDSTMDRPRAAIEVRSAGSNINNLTAWRVLSSGSMHWTLARRALAVYCQSCRTARERLMQEAAAASAAKRALNPVAPNSAIERHGPPVPSARLNNDNFARGVVSVGNDSAFDLDLVDSQAGAVRTLISSSFSGHGIGFQRN